MEEESFKEIKKKIANKMGCNIEELQQQYDKEIITSKNNKDGEKLYILRKQESRKIVNGTYVNNANYNIYTKNGENAGYVNVEVSNCKAANRAEIQYESNIENKGNITISLEEVLKDIFINKALDGLQIKPAYPKTEIKEVFLDISEENIASQAIAKKNGFIKKYGTSYEITEGKFLKNLNQIGRGQMEKELARKIFTEKDYENRKNMEIDVKEYILKLRAQFPTATVTKEFYKGENVLVRATQIYVEKKVKQSEDIEKEPEKENEFVRERGAR